MLRGEEDKLCKDSEKSLIFKPLWPHEAPSLYVIIVVIVIVVVVVAAFISFTPVPLGHAVCAFDFERVKAKEAKIQTKLKAKARRQEKQMGQRKKDEGKEAAEEENEQMVSRSGQSVGTDGPRGGRCFLAVPRDRRP